MKKIAENIIIGIMICLLISCASSAKYKTRTIPSLPIYVFPGPNETEIIVINEVVWPNNIGNPEEYLLFVYIDNTLIAQVAHASFERIIVPNGIHTIMVDWANIQKKPKEIRFTANSERLVFKAFYARADTVDLEGVFRNIISLGIAGDDMKTKEYFLILAPVE